MEFGTSAYFNYLATKMQKSGCSKKTTNFQVRFLINITNQNYFDLNYLSQTLCGEALGSCKNDSAHK